MSKMFRIIALQNQRENMPFQGEQVQMSDDDIDNVLFGEKTPGADSLRGGKQTPPEDINDDAQDDETVIVKGKNKPNSKTTPNNKEGQQEPKVNQLGDDEFLDAAFGEDKEGKEDQNADGQTRVKPDNQQQSQQKQKPGPKPKTQLPEDAEPDYEAFYNHFVKSGVWSEVELPDDVQWNEETFNMVQKLQVKSQYDDLINRTGPAGKRIIEYENNGGKADSMIDLFKEQRAIQDYDISDADGQEAFLLEFYGSQGGSEKSVARIVKSFVDEGPEALKEEAEEKKGLWDKQYNQEIEAESNRQAALKKQAEEDEKTFQKNMVQVLTSDPSLTPKERKELKDYVLNYNQPYRGAQVSQFYMDMLALQNDLPSYAELAKFVKGLKNGDYQKKIADNAKRQTTAKSFLKIKGGSALSGGGGSQVDLGSDEGTNFLKFLQNKK